MNLQQTISKITGLTVSEEDAMCYARDNFGVLASYLRNDKKKELDNAYKNISLLMDELEVRESRIKELETEKESVCKLLNKSNTENNTLSSSLNFAIEDARDLSTQVETLRGCLIEVYNYLKDDKSEECKSYLMAEINSSLNLAK